MEIRVYNWEHFERKKSWFVLFTTALAIVIGISLWFVNLFWAIIIFLFTWAYILFALTKNKHIILWIRDTWLIVETRIWSRQSLDSFVVEIDAESHEWKNIIIVLKNNDHMIFSFDDTTDNKQSFINELQKTIPLIENFPQSTMDRIIRKFQL